MPKDINQISQRGTLGTQKGHLPYMVGVFFCCHNLGMDIKKLYEKVIQSEEVHDIPLLHILAVLNVVIEVIGTGECFYENE